MSPIPAPDSSFISPFPVVAGQPVTILPNLTVPANDWDNIQHAFDEDASEVRLVNGTYWGRYQLEKQLTGPGWKFKGGGKAASILKQGTPDALIELLDAADQLLWNPGSVPCQLCIRPAAVTDQINGAVVEDLALHGSDITPGYEGEGYAVGDMLNIGVMAQIRVAPFHATVSKWNASIVLNGVVPTTVDAASPNPFRQSRIFVYSGINGTGQLFEEGDDYTVTDSPFQITRNATGAIGDGNTVFVNWNNINNQLEASRVDLAVRRCEFRATQLRGKDGEQHANVVFAGWCHGGWPWGPVGLDGDSDPFGNIRVTSEGAATAALLFSQESSCLQLRPDFPNTCDEPFGILNGNHVWEDCDFEGCDQPFYYKSFEGSESTSGPYIFGSATLPKAVCAIRGNMFRDVGATANGFGSIWDTVSGCIMEASNNDWVNSVGAIDSGVTSDFAPRRLTGWVGTACSVICTGNRILGAIASTSLRRAALRYTAARVQRTGGDPTPEVLDQFTVSNNTIEYLTKGKGRGRGGINPSGILVRSIDGGSIDNNIFRINSPRAGFGINMISLKASMSGNDFLGWQKAGGFVDIKLGTATAGCVVVAKNPTDQVQDLGTGNSVTIPSP